MGMRIEGVETASMKQGYRVNQRTKPFTFLALAAIGMPAATTAFAGSLPNAVASFVLQDDSDSLQEIGVTIASASPISQTLGAISPTSGGIVTTGAIDSIAAATIPGPNFTTVQVPALTANSIIEGVQGTSQSTAAVVLNYNFIVIGPPNTEVPISLWLNHGVTISNPNPEPSDGSYGLQGTDTVNLQGPQDGDADAFQTLGHEVLEAGYDSNDPQNAYDTYTSSYSLTGFTSTHVTSDSVETIYMQASSYVVFSISGLASGSIHTVVDPYITIDPSFALADEFTVEVSPNIGNEPINPGPPASIPEPSTLSLLGAAALLALCWRRRGAMLSEPRAVRFALSGVGGMFAASGTIIMSNEPP